MSDSTVIRFANVTKRFKLASANSSLLESLLRRLRLRPSDARELVAVNNVSFDVARGQSVGLIGHNGSGKSTLLKLATRILQPSGGSVAVIGRISALLELGTGFHPDLSGRENIYLNASILGLSRREIESRIDDIINFSELHQFIETPVKHYSSGMYMRLGFSVAVHCDPDVLLIDEILAVGDRAFQKKCLERIYRLKQRGVTIIMVSHNLDVLLKLCEQIVWMERGNVREIGDAASVISRYIESMNEHALEHSAEPPEMERTGTFEAEIVQVRMLNAQNEESETVTVGDPLTIELHYIAHEPIDDPEFGIAMFRSDGLFIAGPNNRAAGQPIEQISGEGVVRICIDALPLLPDRYSLTTAIHGETRLLPYDSHDYAYTLNVLPKDGAIRHGAVDIPAKWEWQSHKPIT